MSLSFSPMDRPSAGEILRWRYEPPYDIYNLQDVEDALLYALDPQNNFYVIRDQNAGCVGFCSFGEDGQVPGGDYTQEALDIGMGIQPELTGRGLGSSYVAAVVDYARRTFAPKCLRVTIAAFNQRAQSVWQKNGFQQVQAFRQEVTQREFVVMFREVQAADTLRSLALRRPASREIK